MEQTILRDMQNILTNKPTAFNEVFMKGGRIKLRDHKYYYFRWNSDTAISRDGCFSSHYSKDPSYAQRGPTIMTALIGTTEDGQTWIQLEGHTVDDWCAHIKDFFYSCLYNINVGPRGTSIYTEINPYIL
jgi:hypothetical protein